MIRSPRILVGAALALALVGSADARQYKNSGAPTESIGVVPEVNDQAVSTANPLPVAIQGGNATAVKTDGSATTQPVSAASLPLPAGAATAGNQATALASLATIAQRAVIYNDAANQVVSANTLQSFPIHDLGAAPAYSRTNAVFFASVAGTAQLLQCQDSGCAIGFIVSSQPVSAGQFATLTAPVFVRYFRTAFQPGGTAGTVSVSVSATAN